MHVESYVKSVWETLYTDIFVEIVRVHREDPC
jgi:hypothetical protein